MTGSGLGPGGKGRRCLDVLVNSQVTSPTMATIATLTENEESNGVSMLVRLVGQFMGLEVALVVLKPVYMARSGIA